jgi:hypothetical protein
MSKKLWKDIEPAQSVLVCYSLEMCSLSGPAESQLPFTGLIGDMDMDAASLQPPALASLLRIR